MARGLFWLALVGVIVSGVDYAARHITKGRTFSVLSPAHREAMAWVARETPGSRFVIRSPDTNWSEDEVAEWFPVLSNTVSLNTVQGTEWLPNGRFGELVAKEEVVRNAAECDEIVRSVRLYGAPTHVWVEPDRPEYLFPSRSDCFENDPAFTEVYRNPGVVIFRTSAAP